MPELDRRSFLAGAGALLVAPPVVRPAGRRGQPSPAPFSWGVASFDPTPTSVLLWTRVTPSPDGSAVPLRWALARDEAMTEVVAEGDAAADPDRGWCTWAEATGLPPGQTWWFAFTDADGSRSPVGRTRTMPADAAAGLRVAAVSCSRFATGGFAVYRALAERELDLVVHLGDYIYEDGASEARPHEPAHELRSVDDYRARYAQHRADPDLQALHARHPMVAVWDDHEIAGNAWRDGAPGHDEATMGPWSGRAAAALRAHREWLPGRTPEVTDGRLRAWRSVPLGGLAELLVLDTRLWGRDRQAATAAELAAEPPRSLLGDDQMAFATERLRASDRAPWIVVANQVMFHPLRVPVPSDALAGRIERRGFLVMDGQAVNPDQWDGYPEAREELSVAMGSRGGVVVLTGDVHSSWAWEGPANDGGQPAMIELVAPSVSSVPFAEVLPIPAVAAEAALSSLHDDLSFIEIESHGYLLVDLDAERVQGEWWYIDPADPGSQRFGAARTAPISVPMRLAAADAPTADPAPAAGDSGSTTLAPVPDEPTSDDDPPILALGGAAIAAVAGAAVAAVALAVRRRRT